MYSTHIAMSTTKVASPLLIGVLRIEIVRRCGRQAASFCELREFNFQHQLRWSRRDPMQQATDSPPFIPAVRLNC
ncbi:MAG: hypothetical protein MHMPM18_004140 [Marteilia pararefringens]